MTKKETVVVIDGGGRGHTLARKYLDDPNINVAGIPGGDFWKVGYEDRVTTYPGVKTTDRDAIAEICGEIKPLFIDNAQDNSVAVGNTDNLTAKGFKVLGPTRTAGRLEWSKAYTREVADAMGIPQPKFKTFHSPEVALDFVRRRENNKKRFIKADGLLGGKGALGARNKLEALYLLGHIDPSDNAWNTFLMEDWLEGDGGKPIEEFSLFTISDGTNNQLIGSARDYKRVFDKDEGENTGGMGCSTPHSSLTPELIDEAKKIQDKFVQFMADKGTPYVGVMYGGFALVERNGKPEVVLVEENGRWGDPEAQVLVPGIKRSLVEVAMAAIEGNLANYPIEMDELSRVAVAGASKGYPGDYSSVMGMEINGLDQLMKWPGVKVIGGGIKVEKRRYYANGGRLFYIVGEGTDTCDAQARAYEAIEMISIDGDNLHYRTDIGDKDTFSSSKDC
jgi:phosphoribosylamine--glycine ligase